MLKTTIGISKGTKNWRRWSKTLPGRKRRTMKDSRRNKKFEKIIIKTVRKKTEKQWLEQ